MTDDEELYRRVRQEYTLAVDGKLRCGRLAFMDRLKEPSVDRANLCGRDPRYTRLESSDAVARLAAAAVRAIRIVKAHDPSGADLFYQIDVVPDPIVGDPELPDNPAHARIRADETPGSSKWKLMQEALARQAVVVLEPYSDVPPSDFAKR